MVLSDVTDVYEIKMSLRIPAIVDNMQSQGRRVYKLQQLRGTMEIHYSGKNGDTVSFSLPALSNLTYKIRDVCVSYETTLGEDIVWTAIGNNKTDSFKQATLRLDIDANPSYNIGDDEPDNTLIATVSCYGSQFGVMRGNAAGQLGCGCHAYGHVSPTRAIGAQGATDKVVDIAACMGNVAICWKGYVRD